MLTKAKNDHANIKTTFLMNLQPEKNVGYLHEISWKKMFCAKKVTKLPDLTVRTYLLYVGVPQGYRPEIRTPNLTWQARKTVNYATPQ
jgi:hypothetical protein